MFKKFAGLSITCTSGALLSHVKSSSTVILYWCASEGSETKLRDRMDIAAQRDGRREMLKIVLDTYVHRIENSVAGDLSAASAYVEIVDGSVTRLFAEHALGVFVVLVDKKAAQERGEDYRPRNPWRTYDLVARERWVELWNDDDLLDGVAAMNERAALFYDTDRDRYILAEDLERYSLDGREELDANAGNIISPPSSTN